MSFDLHVFQGHISRVVADFRLENNSPKNQFFCFTYSLPICSPIQGYDANKEEKKKKRKKTFALYTLPKA